jgi:hypothetical protein
VMRAGDSDGELTSNFAVAESRWLTAKTGA